MFDQRPSRISFYKGPYDNPVSDIMDGPRRSVEQIEVIEHHITEERRPAGSGVPYTSIRKSTETFERQGDEVFNRRYEVSEEKDIHGRYDITGERDVSRDASFLHNSANYGQQLDYSPERPNLNTSVNNYGYDVHEVHTSGGGARIVETHGGGPLVDRLGDRLESTRIDETPVRPGISSALRSSGLANRSTGSVFTVPSPTTVKNESWRQNVSSDQDSSGLANRSTGSVFTVPSPTTVKNESWRQNVSSDQESFVRKDSYKRMQQSQDVAPHTASSATMVENSRTYAPQSQSTLISNSSKAAKKVGCLARTKQYFTDLYWAIKNHEWTPALLANLCCILLLLLMLLLLLGILISALFNRYAVHEFLLFPPVCEECRRKNPSLATAQMPSSVYVHYYSGDQAHFELRGNQPFKSNSFTAVDFSTGYIAIADHALTDSQGKHTTCFLMPLDRTALPSMDALMEALDDSDYEIQAEFGWQEFWQFEPEEIDYSSVRNKFTEPVKDCINAKWYLLKQSVHPRDGSCSDCYDFCLPDYAVVRKAKYEDESTLGIRRLDCFRLYVPEWKQFSVQSDAWGGHWQYPLSSINTRRDSNSEWQNWHQTSNGNRVQRRAIIGGPRV